MAYFNNDSYNNGHHGAPNRKEGRRSKSLLNTLAKAVIDKVVDIAGSHLFGECDFSISLDHESLPVNEKVVQKLAKPQPEVDNTEAVPEFATTETSSSVTAKDSPPPNMAPVVMTTLLKQGDTIHSSLYECGGCHEKIEGRHMKAPLIDSKKLIPSDDRIVEESLCKWCIPDGGGWLAGTLKYAMHARENKVALATRLMSAYLYGDPDKSESVRNHYLRTHNEEARAQKALDIYDRMIADCSSSKVFKQTGHAVDLMMEADTWYNARKRAEESTLAEKRESTIRTRILAGNFKRAQNSLKAAMQEFPNYSWYRIESELRKAIQHTEELKKLEEFKTAIKRAVKNDEVDTMFDLIDSATRAFPSTDWESFADEQMDS